VPLERHKLQLSLRLGVGFGVMFLICYETLSINCINAILYFFLLGAPSF
jgi:hypothetical protein